MDDDRSPPPPAQMLLNAVLSMRQDKSLGLVGAESPLGIGDGVIASRPQVRSASPKRKGGDIPDKHLHPAMTKRVEDAVMLRKS